MEGVVYQNHQLQGGVLTLAWNQLRYLKEALSLFDFHILPLQPWKFTVLLQGHLSDNQVNLQAVSCFPS